MEAARHECEYEGALNQALGPWALFPNIKKRPTLQSSRAQTSGLLKIHKYNGYKLSIRPPGAPVGVQSKSHAVAVARAVAWSASFLFARRTSMRNRAKTHNVSILPLLIMSTPNFFMWDGGYGVIAATMNSSRNRPTVLEPCHKFRCMLHECSFYLGASSYYEGVVKLHINCNSGFYRYYISFLNTC